MTGCVGLSPPMVKKPPTVSSYLLTTCKPLSPPEDGKFSTITGKLVETVGKYRECQLKQEALIHTVKRLEAYIKSN